MHLWWWIAIIIVGTTVESFIIPVAPTTVTSTQLFVPQKLLIQCIPHHLHQQQLQRNHYLVTSRSCSPERHCVGHYGGGRITALSAVTQENTNDDDDDDDGEDIVTTKTKRRTWEENYQLLVSYKETNGNCNVPQKYKDDPRLGLWVNGQRQRKDRLSDERIAKLDDLGFSWSVFGEKWEEMFEKLKEYKTKHGNCNVPRNYIDDSPLGNWVHNQRKQKDKLSDERIVKLDDLEFLWSKELYEDLWEDTFEKLVEYTKRNNGDCNIPVNNDNDKNKELYKWVEGQRKRKSLLSEDRLAKLDNLGLLWEDANKVKADQKWNEKYERLKKYKQNYGDCRVPQRWEEDPALGLWVCRQRQEYKMNKLCKERIIQLDKMSFTWKARDSQRHDSSKMDWKWFVMYGRLLIFLNEHGHCDVPRGYKKDQSLGHWVRTQRQNQKLIGDTTTARRLGDDRKELLDDIGLRWSFDDQRDKQWREKYEELKSFKEQNGHLRLPKGSLESWACQQRVLFSAGRVPQERKTLLDEIEFRWEIDTRTT